MRASLLIAAALATRGCVPDFSGKETRSGALLVLGACAFALLLLVVLRAVAGDKPKDEEGHAEDPRDRDAAP